MKKKMVKLLLSLGVLAVLGGVYLGIQKHTQRQEEQEREIEEQSEKIVSVDSNKISALKFVIDKKIVTFEKKEDSWIKSDEPDFPVDQDKLTEAVGQLKELTADRVLTDVKSLSEYGLDAPSNTITITEEDGTETVLKVGMKNESTDQYYLEKDDDESNVYVVESSTVMPFEKTLYEYAMAGTFPSVDSASITEIQVQKKDDDGYLLKKDSDSALWNVESKDGEEKANTSKVNSLSSAISGIAYDRFVDYHCEDLEKYGLEKPYATISVIYQQKAEEESDGAEEVSEEDESSATDSAASDQKEQKLEIQIGEETDEDSRYICVNESNEIYTISNETLTELLDLGKDDFLDLTVSYIAENQLDHLQVTYKGDKHEMSVSRETSTDEDGAEKEAVMYLLDNNEVKSTAFSRFYNKLINMTGQKRLLEPYKPSEDAELEVVFTDLDGKRTEVRYYLYDTNFYAAVSGESAYLVNKMNVREMVDAWNELEAA